MPATPLLNNALPHAAGRPRVLVVDDEPPVLITTAAILEDDYDVETAENARKALAALTRAPFDVVCTDLNMPGIDGFQLLRRVQEMPGHIGAVLITGYREYAVKVGEDHAPWFLVVKPFNPAYLLEVVARSWQATVLRRSASELARSVRGSTEMV
jgi:DNA-binding NtrC family response regulator